MGVPCSDHTPWALAVFSREPAAPISLAPLQFQVFLKQVNSSLVDSNMLVRCVTLSLDRFESQVDVKGKKGPVPKRVCPLWLRWCQTPSLSQGDRSF